MLNRCTHYVRWSHSHSHPRRASPLQRTLSPRFPQNASPNLGHGNSSSQPPPETEILGYGMPQSPRGSASSTSASCRASPGARHSKLAAPGEQAHQRYKCSPFPEACASLCQNLCGSFVCVMHGMQLGFESTLPYMKHKRKMKKKKKKNAASVFFSLFRDEKLIHLRALWRRGMGHNGQFLPSVPQRDLR